MTAKIKRAAIHGRTRNKGDASVALLKKSKIHPELSA
jgi:hypothetical protein